MTSAPIIQIRDRLLRKSNCITCKGGIRLEGLVGRVRRIYSGNFKLPTILFYPEELPIFTAACKIGRQLNCRPVNTPDIQADLAVCWDGRETRSPDNLLSSVALSTS